jgi:hypothetical protein
MRDGPTHMTEAICIHIKMHEYIRAQTAVHTTVTVRVSDCVNTHNASRLYIRMSGRRRYMYAYLVSGVQFVYTGAIYRE